MTTLITRLLVLVSLCSAACTTDRLMDTRDRRVFAEINFARERQGLRPMTWEEFNHTR